MIYVGIDVGKSGAISWIDDSGKMTVVPTPVIDKDYDMQKMYELLLNLKKLDKVLCVIERAQAMPRQGVVSMFEFGRGYGVWLGLLSALEIPYQIIHSRVWTRHMLEGSPDSGKTRGLLIAERLFPDWQPKKKKEWAYADAILLAEYCRRIAKNSIC